MKHIIAKNMDGSWKHYCLDCKASLPDRPDTVSVWICKCARREQKGTLPTVTVGKTSAPKFTGARHLRNIFKKPPPRCASLGGPSGEKVKVSCGNTYRQPQECLCPSRVKKISRSGDVLPTLAAWGWWCGDLGKASSSTEPKVYQYCQACPYYKPQLLLPAPPGE